MSTSVTYKLGLRSIKTQLFGYLKDVTDYYNRTSASRLGNISTLARALVVSHLQLHRVPSHVYHVFWPFFVVGAPTKTQTKQFVFITKRAPTQNRFPSAGPSTVYYDCRKPHIIPYRLILYFHTRVTVINHFHFLGGGVILCCEIQGGDCLCGYNYCTNGQDIDGGLIFTANLKFVFPSMGAWKHFSRIVEQVCITL